MCSLFNFRQFVRNSGRVEAMGSQPPPAEESLRIRDLEYPRASRPFCRIIQGALPVDIKKYFLDEIISFTIVPQNSAPQATHYPRITMEQKRQAFKFSCDDS